MDRSGVCAPKAARPHGSVDPFRAAFTAGALLLAVAGVVAWWPDAVRGAKALFNRLANADAAAQFAEERRVIGALIGTPNQKEAITANFENRAPAFTDPS